MMHTNFTYYKAIYLNATPNALDMSLLDEAPMMRNEDTYQSRILYTSDTALTLQANDTLWHTTLPQSLTGHQEVWIKWQITLQTTKGLMGLLFERHGNAGTSKGNQNKIISCPGSGGQG